jgi:hypothetical protein
VNLHSITLEHLRGWNGPIGGALAEMLAVAPLLRYLAMLGGAAQAAGATMEGSTRLEASPQVVGTEASASRIPAGRCSTASPA